MSIGKNKEIIQNFYESFGKEESVQQIREAENREVEAEKVVRGIFAEYYAPDCVIHATEGDRSLEDDIKETAMYLDAFPDLKVTIEDMVAEDDRVAFRGVVRTTHSEEFMGITASGKQIAVPVSGFAKITEGKIAEWWNSPDRLSWMQQIGAVPS